MEKDFMQVSKLLFPEKSTLNKPPTQQFEEHLRNQLHSMRQKREKLLNPEAVSIEFENENYKEIADFIKQHVFTVGKEQAVKDFQTGLNFLHKDLKEQLKEDGEFGEKTFRAFYDIFKHYGIDIIKNAIRKGAVSNTVISTSSNYAVNTKALVNQIQDNLGGLR